MLSNLERKFGRFAIPNLTTIFIVGQVAMLLLCKRDPQTWERIVLVPSRVLDGEVYRLVSFLLLPPGGAIIWAVLFWYLFYLMGNALEASWGTFRFNVFLLIGYLATVAVSFIAPESAVTNGFLEGSVFFAFAYLNPNFQLMLALVIPVKIKWLALMGWAVFTMTVITGNWHLRLAAIAGVFNFFVFFGGEITRRMLSGQQSVTSGVKRFGRGQADFMHKCATCGITDADDSSMEFRYCSKCSGDLCYCSEHLRSHEHVWNTSMDQG